MDIQQAFDQAIDEKIDARSAFEAKRAALEVAIRSKLELKISQLPVAQNKRKHVGETTEATVALMLDAAIEASKKRVADILWETKQIHISTQKVPDHVCAPFLDKVGQSALAALD